MSGKNNVNPDHYKVAGRDRPNEVLSSEPRLHDEAAYAAPAKGRRAPNFIPGALPVGEAPAPRKRPKGAGPATRTKRRTPTERKRAKRTTRATGAARKGQAAPRRKRPAPRARRKAS
jgi:hypothetical protein